MNNSEYLKSEFKAYFDTIRCFNLPMHAAAALEFQYALNHFFAAYTCQDATKQYVHQEKAAGHLHRSHLDWLKCNIFEIQNCLPECEFHAVAHFALRQSELRKEELDTLAAEREKRLSIFERYRSLLADLLRHREKIKIETNASLPFSQSDGKRISHTLSLMTQNLYREWVYLEAMAATRTGERIYDHIQIVVQAFTEGPDRLNSVLPPLIAFLKLSFLIYLNKAYQSKNQNADFDMFEHMVTNDIAVRKWKELRNIAPADIISDLTGEQISKVLAGIDDLFHHYEFFVKKYLNA